MSSRRRRQLLIENDIPLGVEKLNLEQEEAQENEGLQRLENTFKGLNIEEDVSDNTDESINSFSALEHDSDGYQQRNITATNDLSGCSKPPKKEKSNSKKTKLNSEGKSKKSKNESIKAQKSQTGEQNKRRTTHKPGILSNMIVVDPFFSVDPRNFNYEAEFARRLRNKPILNKEELRVKRNLTRPRYIVSPEPTWPPINRKFLTSEIVRTESDGTAVVHLKYSPGYYADQISFLRSTERGDFNSNMLLLHHSPYHLCSLLQVSDILRSENKINMADEFLKRSIYAVQSSLPSSLHIFSGKLCLPYLHYQNRAFHIALMKMTDLVVSKGCWNAALEFSKFLLSLDPNVDPLAVLSIIDYYAIRSKMMTWYLDLTSSESYFPLMDKLPNSMYSIALSYYELYLDSKNEKQQQRTTRDEDLLAKSNRLLRAAIIKYPSVVHELQRYCEWNNPKFESPKFNRNDVDHRSKMFIALFAKHNYSLWKIPEVYSWLTKSIDEVFNDISPPAKNFISDEHDSSVTDALVPLYRRILISTEDPYLRGLIPKRYISSSISLLDPIPPAPGPYF